MTLCQCKSFFFFFVKLKSEICLDLLSDVAQRFCNNIISYLDLDDFNDFKTIFADTLHLNYASNGP